MTNSGILLVDKNSGCTSFQLVALLRKTTKIQKIGHAGTLDPFATGLMVMLIGRDYTKKSNQFLESDKEYKGVIHLGVTTDTYDLEGNITNSCDTIPTLEEVTLACQKFSGNILQTPPMYSAKKIGGKKLCDLARKGIVIERQPVQVSTEITLLSYSYPYIEIQVKSSKGTYIRSLAHDIGNFLNTGAHLKELQRVRSGEFHINDAISQDQLKNPEVDLTKYLRHL